MKSKRRHEMQTNALADWLGNKLETIKPHANFILLGALVVVIGIVAIVLLIRRGQQQTAEAWRDYTIEANKIERDPVKLTKVSQGDPESAAHLWALKIAADTQRNKGINLLYEDRDEGLAQLSQAVKLYEQVLEVAESDFLQRQARHGLAKALESMGNVDAAIEQYTELTTAAGDYALGKDAKQQLARLTQQRDFYKSFADFKADVGSPGRTFEPLPERPDISFPGDTMGSGGEFLPGDTTSSDDSATVDVTRADEVTDGSEPAAASTDAPVVPSAVDE